MLLLLLLLLLQLLMRGRSVGDDVVSLHSCLRWCRPLVPRALLEPLHVRRGLHRVKACIVAFANDCSTAGAVWTEGSRAATVVQRWTVTRRASFIRLC